MPQSPPLLCLGLYSRETLRKRKGRAETFATELLTEVGVYYAFKYVGKVASRIITQSTSKVVAKTGVNLVEALNKVGGSRAASEFLGWGNKTTILKTASDFTRGQLIKAGYTKQVLTEIYSGLMEAAKKTIPSTGQLNPASVARANQIEQILKMHFK